MTPCERMSAQGCEVTAVKLALEAIPSDCDVVICSDSQWTVQEVIVWACIWEQQEGKEIASWNHWKAIIDIIRRRTGSTEVKHVKAHIKQHTLEGYYSAKVGEMAKKAVATAPSVIDHEIKVATPSQGKERASSGKLQADVNII